MFIAEICLLQAIRNKLVTDLALNDKQCGHEMEGQLPDAIAPKLYIAVSPAGMSMGPRHRSSGGVIDLVFSVKVTVYNRVTEVARDRRESVFMQLLAGMAPVLERVISSLDNNYPVLDAASEILTDTIADITGDVPAYLSSNLIGEWPEPFRTFNPELSPRMIFRDPYDAAQMAGPPADPIVALARSVTFSGARYMRARTNWTPTTGLLTEDVNSIQIESGLVWEAE